MSWQAIYQWPKAGGIGRTMMVDAKVVLLMRLARA